MDEALINQYFDWMYDIVCDGVPYRKLLMELFNTEFYSIIENDNNRAADGLNLRYRFSCEYHCSKDFLTDECSVLEMMIALAIRCEEDFMDDPAAGNRVGQWFWTMIVNLGLGQMNDENYNSRLTKIKIRKFLNREYQPNGKGGLFAIENCDEDLREIEIWYQLCWYIDTIMEKGD